MWIRLATRLKHFRVITAEFGDVGGGGNVHSLKMCWSEQHMYLECMTESGRLVGRRSVPTRVFISSLSLVSAVHFFYHTYVQYVHSPRSLRSC